MAFPAGLHPPDGWCVMSFQGPATAVTAQVAAATASTTLFSITTSVSGRNFYNASTAVCYLTYGTVSSSTAYTTQVAANTNYGLPVPTYAGPVSGSWTAANGTAYTTQW